MRIVPSDGELSSYIDQLASVGSCLWLLVAMHNVPVPALYILISCDVFVCECWCSVRVYMCVHGCVSVCVCVFFPRIHTAIV